MNGPNAHPLYKFLRSQQPVSYPSDSRTRPLNEGALEWNYVRGGQEGGGGSIGRRRKEGANWRGTAGAALEYWNERGVGGIGESLGGGGGGIERKRGGGVASGEHGRGMCPLSGVLLECWSGGGAELWEGDQHQGTMCVWGSVEASWWWWWVALRHYGEGVGVLSWGIREVREGWWMLGLWTKRHAQGACTTGRHPLNGLISSVSPASVSQTNVFPGESVS